MSKYLAIDETDYVPAGIKLNDSLIIRASAIIDAYCKREIAVKSYTERVPLTEQQRGHLSYSPVIEITALKGRPKFGWTGDNLFGSPQFQDMDLSVLDVDKEIGSFYCGGSLFGAPYTEIEATYTSGWAPIPDKVKVACGLIIAKLANNVNPNVKAKKDFDFSIEYFGSKLVTDEIADLLSEYVVRPLR